MGKQTVPHRPAEAKPEPAPLTLADVTVTVPRFSNETKRVEPWSFSGEQLARLLEAHEHEGNLHGIFEPTELAQEIRGVCSCLEALTCCRRDLTDVDADEEQAALDFLGTSLRRIADRVATGSENASGPAKYAVEIRTPGQEGGSQK